MTSRDPRQARFLTLASLQWLVRNRAWTRWYLVRYWRFLVWRLRNRDVICEGFVFLGRRAVLTARPGHARLVVGRWVHVGDGARITAHAGSLRIGDKCVFGGNDVVTCYLDVEIGDACLLADSVYITDFDHRFSDVHVPIKDQGIVTSPVRIGPDVWMGTRVSVLRGVTVGRGSVLAAHTVVTRDVPDWSVVAGVPARVLRSRQADYAAAQAERDALADMARKAREAARD